MPFVGTHNGDTVTPIDVGDDQTVECPVCNGEMYVKNRYTRETRDGETWVARHFTHTSRDDCGGESDIHLQMKSVAASRAREEWPNATVSLEEPIGDRRADILVSFPETHERYGDGIGIEVQHKNEDKDVEQVTGDYIGSGYSILWLYEEDFDKGYTDVDIQDESVIVWWARQVPRPGKWIVREWELKDTDVQMLSAWEYKIEASFTAEWMLKDGYRYFIKKAWESGREEYKDEVRQRIRDWVRTVEHSTNVEEIRERIQEVVGEEDDQRVMKKSVAVLNQRISEVEEFKEIEEELEGAKQADLEPLLRRARELKSYDLRTDAVDDIHNKNRKFREKKSTPGNSPPAVEMECENCSAKFTTSRTSTGETKRTRRCGECGEWMTLINGDKGVDKVTAEV